MLSTQNKWHLTLTSGAGYLIIALIYYLLSLTYAFQYGRLAGLFPWDDCRDMVSGLRNADGLLTSSNPIQFILSGGLNFHAPLADFQTLAGLVLFDFNYFLTYLLGFVHIVALLCFLDYYFRDSKGFLNYGIMLLVLSLPIVQWFPAELKSDMKGGMYLMIALLLLFESGSRGLSWKRASAICAAFTLASIAKVTAFYIPLYCFGVLGMYWLIHLYCAKRLWEGEDIQPASIVFKRCLIIFTAFLFAYLIFVLPDIRHHFRYIKQALSDKWVEQLPLIKHLLYYTPFGASSHAWSPFWLLLLMFAPLALLRAFKTHREGFLKLLGLFLAAVILWLPLLVANTYNPSFGSYFYFAVFGCFLLVFQFIGKSISAKSPTLNWYTAILWLAIIVCVLFQPKLIRRYTFPNTFPTEINLKSSEIITEIAGQIYKDGGGRKVTFLFDNLMIPHPNLEITYYQLYHKFLRIKRIDLFQDVKKGVDSADFVLALDNPMAKYLIQEKAWTISLHIPEVLAIMKKREDYRLIEKYSILNFNIYLFKKRQGT